LQGVGLPLVLRHGLADGLARHLFPAGISFRIVSDKMRPALPLRTWAAPGAREAPCISSGGRKKTAKRRTAMFRRGFGRRAVITPSKLDIISLIRQHRRRSDPSGNVAACSEP
jgi:hypothetical protein